MGRTIDLDLAVNALQQEMKLHPCGSGEWFVLSSCLGKLADLPSAQPEPCEDAVSRADVEIEIANLLKGVFVEYEDIAKKVAARLPSVTPQRKTGKWIDQKGGGCCCSECGRYALDEVDGNFIHVAAKSKYCPNCGLKMEG